MAAKKKKKQQQKQRRSDLYPRGPVLVRTVTHYYTGNLTEVSEGELRLTNAAWIADTGRFSTALTTGVLSEVEPYPGNVILSRGAVIDVCAWAHPLPREVK